MTSILAYDIDGRPLRAGDRVVVLDAMHRRDLIGRTVTIIGPPTSMGDFDVNVPHGMYIKWAGAFGHKCRRLDANHTPAETGFTELMTNLKTGSLEPLEIE